MLISSTIARYKGRYVYRYSRFSFEFPFQVPLNVNSPYLKVEKQGEPIAWWIILLCILGAVLIIGLIVFILYKVSYCFSYKKMINILYRQKFSQTGIFERNFRKRFSQVRNETWKMWNFFSAKSQLFDSSFDYFINLCLCHFTRERSFKINFAKFRDFWIHESFCPRKFLARFTTYSTQILHGLHTRCT